jgi:bacterial leucyl aminopeptidase
MDIMRHRGVSTFTVAAPIFLLTLLLSFSAFASPSRGGKLPILTDVRLLHAVGITPLTQDYMSGTAYAMVDSEQRDMITAKAHEWGRCGGYELLVRRDSPDYVFGGLQMMQMQNTAFMRTPRFLAFANVEENETIKRAVSQVSASNLESMVKWLSSYPDRYNRSSSPNKHVQDLFEKLKEMASNSSLPVQIDALDHKSTPQKSLRLHIQGKTRPNEIVVLGGHLDSINQGWFGKKNRIAPGADDNASGSSNLLEAVRILLQQPQPERSIEFFWYAGEEEGLLGSAEIASAYRAQSKDVVGALQLDMTLHPGEGEFVLASMSDFTSAWLREYFVNLNSAYVGAKIVNDRCGYGCSDHASWHRNGYPALMPFEATMRSMNHNIHTENDVIDSGSSFAHSAMFSKIAVAFAMDLANSDARAPEPRR